MALKRVSVKEEKNSTLKDQLLAVANHDVDGKGSMSNSRFLGTFVSLFLGLVLVYSSVFYVPAFLDVQKIMGASNQNGKVPATDANSGKLSSYRNFFKIRRGYIRRGQALTLEYDLAPGTTMTASIRRCSAPPVVEVFYCRNIEGQQIKISGGEPGKRNFIMRKPGFYYFDEIISQNKKLRRSEASDEQENYQVLWTRRNLQPA